MALENNSENTNDITQFLARFKTRPSAEESRPFSYEPAVPPAAQKPSRDHSFEKLEHKIQELEERFEATSAQNRLILSELASTRDAVDRQKSRDAFLEHIANTINNLKASVENLARARARAYDAYEAYPRGFDAAPAPFPPFPPSYQNPAEELLQTERRQHQQELAEKEEKFSSLHQKTSQLRAVNTALDREIKRVQQEKMAALKKSAEQAKEILSLRDQLTAAEERFKSFNFEGRIISVRQEYEQKVSSLENQLQEISATCMKQVEEIESLRAQNAKLHTVAEEKEQVLARLQAKEQELENVKARIAVLEQEKTASSKKQLTEFSLQMHTLEMQRQELSAQFQQAGHNLEEVRREKELLEKNFKELVAKINENDAVIEQLKQKIEVLGKQNEALAQQKETLSQQNAALQEEKAQWNGEKQAFEKRALTAEQDRDVLISRSEALYRAKQSAETQAAQLGQEKEALAQKADALQKQTEALNGENEKLLRQTETLQAQNTSLANQHQTLNAEKETLSAQMHALEQQTKSLSEEKQSLTRENQQLRAQSAALLAARLVQAKERASQKETLSKQAPCKEPVMPAPPLAAETAARSFAAGQPPAPPAAAAGQDAAEVPFFEAPVEVNAQAESTVRSEEDLPEIRVADPIPQPDDPLFDADDFLMKTDSFIGRMKWSLFREDK